MFHRIVLVSILLLGLAPLPAVVVAASLHFEQVNISGASMNLPRGWQRLQDDYSLILMESPQAESSPVLALFALAAQPGNSTSPAQLADAVFRQLDLGSHGFAARLVEERNVGPALYRMHALQKDGQFGYLASYSHTDPASGALIHMFFSALAQRFIELGGTVLPLVAFAGLDPVLIEQIKAESAQAQASVLRAAGSGDGCQPGQSYEVCLAEQWFGAGGTYEVPSTSSVVDAYTAECGRRTDAARNAVELSAAQAYCDKVYQNASQILRMGHETSMKILYNMDSGWCYQGEIGC